MGLTFPHGTSGSKPHLLCILVVSFTDMCSVKSIGAMKFIREEMYDIGPLMLG